MTGDGQDRWAKGLMTVGKAVFRTATGGATRGTEEASWILLGWGGRLEAGRDIWAAVFGWVENGKVRSRGEKKPET